MKTERYAVIVPDKAPNIDCAGYVAVIDDSGKRPVWQRIKRIFATEVNVRKVMTEHNLRGAWLLDDCGGKRYFTA